MRGICIRLAAVSFWILIASTYITAQSQVPSHHAAPGITSIGQLWSDQGRHGPGALSVRIEATVFYYDPRWRLLFIGEETSGTYIGNATIVGRIAAGDVVELTGQRSSRPGEFIGSPLVRRI